MLKWSFVLTYMLKKNVKRIYSIHDARLAQDKKKYIPMQLNKKEHRTVNRRGYL